MVDDDDFDWLSQWKWYVRMCKNTIYAASKIKGHDGKRRNVPMHRMILKLTDPKILADHADGNGSAFSESARTLGEDLKESNTQP